MMSGSLRTLVIVMALFLAIWLPRTLALDAFATADEHDWLTFSANFYHALATGELDQSFQIEHPGVPVMWAGALALWTERAALAPTPQPYFSRLTDELEQWLAANTTITPLDLLVEGRWWLILWGALVLTCGFFPLRRLWGSSTAVVAVLLVGWDPFLLALARQLHPDGLAPALVFLALALFAAWLYGGYPWRYLLLSAFVTGLAWITKVPTGVLAPVALLLVGIVWLRSRRQPERASAPPWSTLAGALLLWGGVAGITAFVLWPALWLDAIGVAQRIVAEMRTYAGGHVNPNFFHGQIVADPGPFFYPTVLLFRLTPVACMGLVAWLPLWWQRQQIQPGQWVGCGAFLLFALIFLGVMTTGAKKFDRYVAPVLLMLDLLAAVGWVSLVRLLAARWAKVAGVKWIAPALLAGGVCGQGALSAMTYPYYFTYYNPLVGGARVAQQWLLIGWGEGLDEAARWLNQQPDAEQLRVVSWYPYSPFSYFFKGETGDWSYLAPLAWLDTDYVVIYANQWQRNLPDAAALQHFLPHEPVHVVRLGGLELARIYDMRDTLLPDFVAIDHARAADFGGQIRLVAYRIAAQPVEPGSEIPLTLYLQGLAPVTQNYNLLVRLVGADGTEIWRDDGWPWGAPTTGWPVRTIRPDTHTLTIGSEVRLGLYKLTLALYDPATLAPLPVTWPNQTQPLPGNELGLSLLQVGKPVTPAGLVAQEWRFGDALVLTGVALPATVPTGATVPLTLRWQGLAPVQTNYTVFVHIVGPDGALVAQQDQPPLGGFAPTSLWDPGLTVLDHYQVTLPADALAGSYTVRIGLYTVEQGRLPVQRDGAAQGDFAAIGAFQVASQ
ncbi:MAG: glycosyltransferase family 39 protein [Caldilineaceae bacterium]